MGFLIYWKTTLHAMPPLRKNRTSTGAVVKTTTRATYSRPNTYTAARAKLYKTPNWSNSAIYRCKQMAPPITVSWGASGIASQNAYSFQLNDLDQVTSWSAVFDQYRINKVVLHFRPVFNMTAASSVNTSTSYNYSVVDYDDASPAADTVLREYATCQVHMCTEQFTRTIYPRVAGGVYNGAFTGYSLVPRSTWLDTSSPSIQNYGFKFNIESNPAGINGPCYYIDRTYYMEFKNVR